MKIIEICNPQWWLFKNGATDKVCGCVHCQEVANERVKAIREEIEKGLLTPEEMASVRAELQKFHRDHWLSQAEAYSKKQLQKVLKILEEK